MPSLRQRLTHLLESFRPNASLKQTVEREQLELQRRAIRAQKHVLEDATFSGPNWIGNVVDPYEPLFDDPNFWAPMWGVEHLPPTLNKTMRGELLPVYITWYGLKIIRDFSRRLCTENPFAIGALENHCSYICGKGYQHKLVPKNGKESVETKYFCELGQQWIDTFTSHQRWNEVEQEAVRRCYRDGECFIRFFHVGRGLTEVRFVEPEWVQSPSEREWETYGIVNEPNDLVDVLGYWIYEHPPYEKLEYVPAAEVIHIKLNGDSTSKRGLPMFYPIRKNLERAEKLLRNMSVLAQVQATFAMIRTHKQASSTAISNFQTANADQTWVSAWSGNNIYGKSYRPGTILDAGADISYQFPSSTVNAGNLVAVLQAELRAAGQRVNTPEFMFSGDSSNANMASAFISEAPFVKMMERTQAFFALRFGDGSFVDTKTSGAMWRVLANAVDYGGCPRQVLTDCELIVEGPTLIVRDRAQETQRAAMLNQAGRLSGATWAKWEGTDDEQEVKQWQQEKTRDTSFQLELQKMQAQVQLEIQKAQTEQQMAMQQQAQQAQMQQQMAAQQQQAAAQQAAGQQPGAQQPGADQAAQQQAQQAQVPQGQDVAQQMAAQQAQAQQAAMQQAQGTGAPPGANPQLSQRELLTPRSDSGFVSHMGGDMRNLVGLESKQSEDTKPLEDDLLRQIDDSIEREQ